MTPHKPIVAVATVTMMVASGCPIGELGWECHADKPCPKGELCVAPQGLPEGSTDAATDPACYTVCSSSAQCPGGNRACLDELCVLFDDTCADEDCPEGFFCNTAAHCEKYPASAACDNLVRDGDESDADCGGSCTPCSDGRRCNSAGDCQSGVCDSDSSCAVPTCDDSVANGTEIGVDCGGGCAALCPAGEPCRDAGDCDSGVCSNEENVCQAAACDDGVANQSESAIDCGGPCAGCPDGFACNAPDDCESHVCADHKCAVGNCTDGAENGDETDVDCGGSCDKCAAGLKCRAAADCDSGVCDGGACRLLLSFGNTGLEWAGSVAVTAGDSILVTGYSSQGLDLAGGVVGAGSFLARLEPGGAYLWSETLPDPVWAWSGALAADALGNIVVAFYASGDIYVGSFSLEEAGNQDGQTQWEKTFDGGNGDDYAHDVAVDSNGNVLVAGAFRGEVDFGSPCPRLTSVGMDAFVTKFSMSGGCVWAKGFSNGESYGVTSVAADGSVVATGYFAGNTDLGDGEQSSAGSNDVFVVKLFSDGSHDWSKTFGGSESDFGDAVVDTSDGVVFTGGFKSNSIAFGGEPLENQGGSDLFVAELALDGSHVWSQPFGGVGRHNIADVGVDADDSITLTGKFEGTISLGGPTLESDGSFDIFVARLASGGEHVWSHRFGGPDADWGHGVAIDSHGRAVVIGGFNGAVDFGGTTLTTAGGEDICVFTVAP